MPKTTAQILKDALELPDTQRAELACGLLESLDGPPGGQRSEADWITEIESRARAAVTGEPGLEWESVRRDIERRLQRD